MKMEPIAPTLPKPLTEDERMFLRLQRFRPRGAREFSIARKLARYGLGEIDGQTFTVSPAGVAALSPLSID